ncbi:hypothetical protein FisN_8Hh203 [Fistulifera solaris]|uniref:Uncharacterized protein n=1 Tax=Fistulifera solaris TaxID=1519565 RepID=A0A1Z5JYN7_FISSO|nr:hypothetical protein FisN_8Hh203 [Fistulifera solaris]|eukprot:GAX18982.1 hypothetical protein FisN_8Hh203 [Fistulifera solaris]
MKMQKLAICLTFWLGATCDAFVVRSMVRNNNWMIRESSVTTAEEAFETIGIEQEQLAIGIDPREFLNYIGTKQDLLQKTMNDIPSFDEERAKKEVEKFLLDKEAVGMYIQFQKMREQDPNFVVPSEEERDEGLFSFRNILILYSIYLAYQILPNLFLTWVAKKQETGSWEGTNIPLIDQWIVDKLAEKAAAAAGAAAESVSSASELVSLAVAHSLPFNLPM